MLSEYTLSAGPSVSEYLIHVSTVLRANACPFLELKLNTKSEFNLFIRKSSGQDYRLNKVDKENCYLPLSITILL